MVRYLGESLGARLGAKKTRRDLPRILAGVQGVGDTRRQAAPPAAAALDSLLERLLGEAHQRSMVPHVVAERARYQGRSPITKRR